MLLIRRLLLHPGVVFGIKQTVFPRTNGSLRARTHISWSVMNGLHKRLSLAPLQQHSYSSEADEVLSVESNKLRQYLETLRREI